ncbi:MAG: amidase [Gemmatimonadetes bacterium]|nr:amidase [Gemmatimonadota bacterium]
MTYATIQRQVRLIGGGTRRGLVLAGTLASLLAAACSAQTSASTPNPRAVPDINVVELTTDLIQADFAAGVYTAEELTLAFLDRIRRYEDRYNALISLNPNAVQDAVALDAEYRAKGPRGPLHGVPLVIKDNIDYAGLVTTAGYSGFSSATGGVDMVPQDDAAAVERLRNAGAIILAKTNLPDFAGHGTRTESSVAGQTLNPYNPNKAPGGSSGGTATAVNASFAVAGLGTETGGSIQNPAAAQALVGVKPTFGLVPLEGVVPMSATYVDVVGPLARTARDAAVLLDAIAGPSAEDPRTEAAAGHIPPAGYTAGLSESALEGKRFGLVGDGWRTSFLPLAPETEAHYRAAIDVLIAEGAEVVDDPFKGSGFIEKYSERRGIRSGGVDEMAEYLNGLGDGAPFNSIDEWEALSGQSFRRRGGREGGVGEGEEIQAVRSALPDSALRGSRESRERPEAASARRSFPEWRGEIQQLFRDVLDAHRLDGLFFPQAGGPIPDLVEDPERPGYNPNNHPELPSNIVNDMGLPVVTLPFAYYEDGTPFVLAFVGDVWTEGELLSFAFDLEQATKRRVPPRLEEGSGG